MLMAGHDLAKKPMLIAEVGNNHEGDPVLARELVDAAVEAGADAVKLQVIDPQRLVHMSQTARLEQLARFRLSREVFSELADRVRARGRLFMASVFDVDSLRDAAGDLDAVKVASGDLDFDPLLVVAAGLGKPIILSTGMSYLSEIQRAVGVISAALPHGQDVAQSLCVLHCVSLYPTPLEKANLAAIPNLAKTLRLTIGYSDHTLGLEASVTALALGARVIEKHFTLDKKRTSFRDHALSADPGELAALARTVEAFQGMIGTGERDGELADAQSRATARRSIVVARNLPAGLILAADHLDFLRPADGLSPAELGRVTGRRLKIALEKGHVLELSDIE